MLLPSPRTSDTNGAGHHGDGGMDLRTAVTDISLLPTPVAKEPGGTPEQYRARWQKSDGRDSTFLPLSMAVQLLPTPTAADHKASGSSSYDSGHDGTTLTDATVRQPDRWGEYGPAIRRCEALTRPAPEPTKLNSKGNPKLSDEFDEWLMMLPAGWITDVPGITWNEVLKACGNGVVPPQVVAALGYLFELAVAA